ncbi:MAG: hypothetical protein KKA05_12160 [Alphaproteobacteria bacterium]|nr:hypothetical protein [Alphaproteobacteria bacterium]
MRRKKMQVSAAYPLVSLYLCCVAVQANEIKTTLSASSIFSDNSLKTPDEPIDERQDLYEVGVSAGYSNWLVEANADYEWVSHKYSEQSQVDDNYAEGSSSLLFGKQEDPLALELNHSRKILLTSPDAVALTQNQQEREVISARPEARARIFAADRLFIGGEFTRVNFPENDLQNSRRDGIALGWLHPLSPASFLRLNSQQQKISFEQFAESDYTYSGVMLVYGVELRKLTYGLEVGYNESEPENGESKGAPSYRVSASYLSGFNQLDFSASRSLTDTSFGNGNEAGGSGFPTSDGSSQVVSRMDRSSADLNWQTQIVCVRCQFSTGVSAVKDDYLEKDEASLSINTRVRFSYSFSLAANLSIGFARANVDFDNQSIARDYKLNAISIEYAYNFSNGLSARLAARNEDRTADGENGNGTYEENIYSIGLGYNF